MKRFGFSIFLLGLLLLSFAIAAVGKDVGPSLEVFADSTAETNSHSGRLYQISLNGEGGTTEDDPFKLGFDLSWGLTDDRDGSHKRRETRSFTLKGGYAIVNNSVIRSDLTTGIFTRDFYWEYDYKYDHDEPSVKTTFWSFGLGTDTQLNLGDKLQIYYSFFQGIRPHRTEDYYDISDSYSIDSLIVLNYKLYWSLNDTTGISLGYHCEKVRIDDLNKITFSGYTFGLVLKDIGTKQPPNHINKH